MDSLTLHSVDAFILIYNNVYISHSKPSMAISVHAILNNIQWIQLCPYQIINNGFIYIMYSIYAASCGCIHYVHLYRIGYALIIMDSAIYFAVYKISI